MCCPIDKGNVPTCSFICGGFVVTAGVITMLVTGILGMNGTLFMDPIGARVMVGISSVILSVSLVPIFKRCFC